MDTPFEEIINGILRDGYIVVDQFLSDELVSGLRNNAESKIKDGKFKPAAIGKKQEQIIAENIRNDQIHWIEDDTENEFEKIFLNHINELITIFNRKVFLGIRTKELHYAMYAPGAFYHKHLDAFQKNNKRIVSIVCYLNKQWEASMGGQLRMYLPENQMDIDPLGGRLVCFLSEEIPHEVLPATQNRYSVTGWLKTG